MSYYKLFSRTNINFEKVRLSSCYLLHFQYNNLPVLSRQGFDISGLCCHKRHFSFSNTVDNLTKSQAGIFKSISESTLVEYIQKFLITVHDTTGFPWWASIVISTIIFRTCITLPLAIYQQYIFAKVENINLEMKELVEELKKEVSIAVKKYNWDEKTARFHFKRSAKKQWNSLIVRENCHPFKAGILVIFQIPLWVCLSASLRNLAYMLPYRDLDAELRFIELSVGGFGWIPNLIQTDSTFIFPIVLGLLSLGIVEVQTLSRTTEPSKLQKIMTNVFRSLSVIIIPVSACVPSCLVLYWTTSTAFGLIQNITMLSPKVKRVCGIPVTPSELLNPYTYIATSLRVRLNVVKDLIVFNNSKKN